MTSKNTPKTPNLAIFMTFSDPRGSRIHHFWTIFGSDSDPLFDQNIPQIGLKPLKNRPRNRSKSGPKMINFRGYPRNRWFEGTPKTSIFYRKKVVTFQNRKKWKKWKKLKKPRDWYLNKWYPKRVVKKGVKKGVKKWSKMTLFWPIFGPPNPPNPYPNLIKKWSTFWHPLKITFLPVLTILDKTDMKNKEFKKCKFV